MRRTVALTPCVFLAGALSATPALAQFEDVEIRSTHVAGQVWMLEGRGGNLGVMAGPDGVILVDDQYAPLTGRILAAVAEISEAPLRFLLNTHWHIDHTEGNEEIGALGTVIVAHDKVRERMSTEQFMASIDRRFPPSPPGALPVVTFSEAVGFHLNGEAVRAYHLPRAHTDGDAIVHFPESDVLHLGDIYFAGMYPLVDRSSGGSVQGMIAAVEFALGLCTPDTRVIPGHGALSDCGALAAYGEMLRTATARVAALRDDGKTLDEVVAARPNADFDERLGGGFITPERFIQFIYRSLEDAAAD